MSKYEWENGSIKIPSKHWAPFKKALREAFNKGQTETFLTAKAIHVHLRETTKGQRKNRIDFPGLIRDAIYNGFHLSVEARKAHPDLDAAFSYGKVAAVADDTLAFNIKRSLLNDDRKLVMPKKKDFPKATNKTRSYAAGYEARVLLSNDKLRTVQWSVPENNHASRDARGSLMGKVFFNELDRISSRNGWTRGSGGEIVGNDEYNTESRCSGGGANYTVASFGPSENANKRRVNRYCGFNNMYR
jgi:hypothetical protein